jgi:hypothetical protein
MTPLDEIREAYRNADRLGYSAIEDIDMGFMGVAEPGFFLILFAQFEAEVNIRCRALIAQNKLLPGWRDRRAWESFDERRVNDIPFKRRLALLIDKGLTIYAAVQTLYSERNEIAHGGRLDMVTDFENAYKTLKAALAAMEETP